MSEKYSPSEENNKSQEKPSQVTETKLSQGQRYDTRLRKEITSVFDDLIDEQEKFRKDGAEDAGDDEVFDQEISVLRAAAAELRKLTNNEKQFDASDVSVGLGVLLSKIESDDQEGQESARRNEGYRQLFKKVGDKLYKDTEIPAVSKEAFLDSLKMAKLKSEESIVNLSQEFQDGDDEALLKQLDDVLDNIGNNAGYYARGAAESILDGEPWRDSEKYANGEIIKISFQVYKLEKMRDELRAKIYGRPDITREEISLIEGSRENIDQTQKTEIDEIISQGSGGESNWTSQFKDNKNFDKKENEDKQDRSFGFADNIDFDIGKNSFFPILETALKPDEVLKLITPEMKDTFLDFLLQQLDLGILGAQKFAEKDNFNSIVNRKSVGQFIGLRVVRDATFQKMYLAATGKVLDLDKIHSMPIKDYLKDLGYDLEKDKERSDLLRKFTNALD